MGLTVARRGKDLRAHILWTAKDVFLESGFERASMDGVAARAETSKRSLYAHFGSKENLFLSVVELVRERYLERLGVPGDYAEEPVDALTGFLAAVAGLVLWESVVKTCRMAIAEAERLPEAARGYHEVMFDTPVARIADYLAGPAVSWNSGRASVVAGELLAVILYPRLMRALYAVDPPMAEPELGTISAGVDVEAIRAAVTVLLSRSPQGER